MYSECGHGHSRGEQRNAGLVERDSESHNSALPPDLGYSWQCLSTARQDLIVPAKSRDRSSAFRSKFPSKWWISRNNQCVPHGQLWEESSGVKPVKRAQESSCELQLGGEQPGARAVPAGAAPTAWLCRNMGWGLLVTPPGDTTNQPGLKSTMDGAWSNLSEGVVSLPVAGVGMR